MSGVLNPVRRAVLGARVIGRRHAAMIAADPTPAGEVLDALEHSAHTGDRVALAASNRERTEDVAGW